MNYYPDLWVIVEVYGTEVKKPWYRVLAGWYGGYTGSNSWKLSSGITHIEDSGSYWIITMASGSKYHCHKNVERLSMTTAGILDNLVVRSTTEVSARQVLIEEVNLVRT